MLTFLVTTIALLTAVPLIVLAVECFAAPLPSRRQQLGERTSCAVLIPAHNEESGLAATLADVKSQLSPGDRLVVVADNCTDRTEDIGREHGAEMVVRRDSTRRGKGFALEAGVLHLKESDKDFPQVVVILDADCRFAAGSLDHLVCATSGQGRPFQARYLMCPGIVGPWETRVGICFLGEELGSTPRTERFRLPVPLTGSGMAFPKDVARSLELGTPEIVEDLKLGLDLVVQGAAPRFL